MPAGDDDRVALVAVDGVQRDAGQVERGEHVGVAELGREGQAEQVEVADRAVRVDGELRHPVLAHQGLEVGPHGVGALGQGVGPLVEHFVQDHDALVRHADLVGVGVHQRPAHGGVPGDVPLLDGGVQLAADVLDRLADLLEQRLEPAEDGLSGHPSRVGRRGAVPHANDAVDRSARSPRRRTATRAACWLGP